MFADRTDAGRRLGLLLVSRGLDRPVVLGLPRGGVIVAAEVADALDAPLDVVLVRKLGVPGHEELAFGAIAEGGVRVLDDDVTTAVQPTPDEVAAVERRERAASADRARRYRDRFPPVPVAGRVALVVDDGVATGSTARAACTAVRARGAALVVLAVPVASTGWAARVGAAADECIALAEPTWLSAVGESYRDFRATPDDDVLAALARNRERHPAPPA